MWRARFLLPRRQSLPCLKSLSDIQNGYTSTASILQQVKPATKPQDSGFKEGQEIEGFTVQEVSDIPEFQMKAIRLYHEDTGAQYLHLEREDTNNAFSINLRTTPFNSSGVPHILEHTTLCGSKKYPCRDPFFKMLNRSLATFMNAMTAPDFTLYPFATQNQKDYYNLMSVYMDAVFNPQLKELDFRQEGWRLEHENVDDPKSPIIFKGVVFNEMKGALSDNQRIFAESLMNKILPSHTYGVISGGDPLEIPNLSYNKLREFHSQYYHPSNARFYSYGNFPLINHLKFINDSYLKHYGKVENKYSEITKVPSEKRWSSENKVNVVGKVDTMAPDPAKQCTCAVSYLCSDIKNIDETFTLQVLSELLTSGPNSAFYKSLIEPNVGSNFAPVTGYESQTRDTFFSVGLQGLNQNDFGWVFDTCNTTFNKVINEGFDKTRIEAVLNSVELNTKHQSADFGLRFLYNLSSLWNHDGDLIKALRVNDIVTSFKENLSKHPHFLQEKVEQYFKQNNHKLVLTMTPDEGYEEKKALLEDDLLQFKLAIMSREAKEKIFEDGIKLKEEQDRVQNVDCLPTLNSSDLKHDIENEECSHRNSSGVPIQVSVQPTNCLTYLKGILDTSHLPNDLKPYIPLFAGVATKMGTKHHNYRELDQLVQLKTGGLSLSLHVAENKDDCNSFEDGILFSSFALDSNLGSMLSIWDEIFNHITLKDTARLETLLKATAAGLINSLSDNGHLYVMSASSALVNSSCERVEQNSGLSYIKWLSNLVQENKYEETISKLSEIGESVLNKNFMRLAVNISPDNRDKIDSHMDTFVNSLQGSFEKSHIKVHKTKEEGQKIGVQFESPLPISFTSKSVPTVAYSHKDYAPLRILCRLLTSKYLLLMVREKGGAYGAGARLTPSGVISFYSYRDPNPLSSLNIFDTSLEWINNNEFSDRDVEEAKLGVFQFIDAPIPPGARGSRNFVYGISNEEFKNHRLGLMGVTKPDILRVASLYLSPTVGVSEGRVLLGPSNVDITKREGENWSVLKL